MSYIEVLYFLAMLEVFFRLPNTSLSLLGLFSFFGYMLYTWDMTEARACTYILSAESGVMWPIENPSRESHEMLYVILQRAEEGFLWFVYVEVDALDGCTNGPAVYCHLNSLSVHCRPNCAHRIYHALLVSLFLIDLCWSHSSCLCYCNEA
jgi:hypothetical protein